MQAERVNHAPAAQEEGATPLLRLTVPGEPLGVRGALARVTAVLTPLSLTEGCRASVELVLAEVLNNVVEHAYAQSTGPIQLEIRLADGDGSTVLDCSVVDRGQPMPEGTPPPGGPLILDVPLADLPEGGFGWYLIRSLTQELHYARETGRNRLSFRIPLERQRS